MVLTCYGIRKFDLSKFKNVRNRNWNKPYGGLWTSPLHSKYGWIDWCKAENFHRFFNNRVTLLLSGRILKINSLNDLKTKFDWFEFGYTPDWKQLYPDFEKMAKKYDAIFLTSEGQWRTRLTRPFSLYGWDCECVLILNKRKIKQITSDEGEKIYQRLSRKGTRKNNTNHRLVRRKVAQAS